MICPRCNVEMGPGIAIYNDREPNARYIVPQAILNHETLKLTDVFKCPKCGYSVDGTGQQK